MKLFRFFEKRVLLDYFKLRYPADESLKISNFKNITSGWETEILSFDLEETNSGVQKFIARIYPGSDAVVKAQKEASTMKKI
jgi:hypothetical protein